MTPGKCTVVELNLFRHRQPNSRDERIFKFCHQLCKAKLGDWAFEKVGSLVLLPPVAGNLEALSFEYMLVLFNEICSFRPLDTTRYKCF